jgi:hypothetical protein
LRPTAGFRSFRCKLTMSQRPQWDDLEGLEKTYKIESVSSPSGVTHLTFTRS